jgi:hypothetical protein
MANNSEEGQGPQRAVVPVMMMIIIIIISVNILYIDTPPASAEVKKIWIYTSTPLCAFMT